MEKQINDQLDKIEKSIKELESKISGKWVLPIIILLLTTTFGIANYFLQRHYSNSDIYQNKLKEKIAELRANEEVDFFKQSIRCLDTLDITFESYCVFGPNKQDYDLINFTILRLNNIITNQIKIDRSLKKSMLDYTSFVARSEFNIENKRPADKELVQIYKKSNALYGVTKKNIETLFSTLTE